MYNFIIWDFDGTVFDTYPITAEVYKKELSKIGITETEENLSDLARHSFGVLHRYLAEQYGLDREFWKLCDASRVAEERKRAFAFVGAYGLLSDIVSRGGRNAIYTHRGETAIELLEKAGLKNLFCDFVIGSDGFPAKPAPDAVNALIERNGADRQHSLMVGDREIDVGSGINAGIDAILFRALSYENTKATYTARDFAELRKIIL